MYSRGSNAYGQQPYGAQSAYGHNSGVGFSGTSVGGPDDNSQQQSMVSRHSELLSGSQDADMGTYRSQASMASHYGGHYNSVYGSTGLSSTQQGTTMNAKRAGVSSVEGRSGYPLAMPVSPKYIPGEYMSSSSLGYGHKSDQFSERMPDYSSIDRRQYGERPGSYLGRDLQTESGGRLVDSGSFSHHQANLYDRLEQASLLRQEQMLKAQTLQADSLGGGARQADYLAARDTALRNSNQELLSYASRIDAAPRSISKLSGSSYPVASILGAAPRRDVEDLIYTQPSSNPGYGISLPPGRDYAIGKGLRINSLESDYRARIDDPNEDRGKYIRELELREEERRKENLRERERLREKDRLREREREREREKERILERRNRERESERKRGVEAKRERSASRISKEHRGASLTKDGGRPLRQDSPRREASHRRHSPVKEKRRDYECKVHSSSVIDVERDYLSLDKRYPRLFISPEFSKVVVNWPKGDLKLSIHTPVSFEHDFVGESISEEKQPAIKMTEELLKSNEGRNTVWVAKMLLMSGLSKRALEDLSSEKSYDDRIPHLCNILRFAMLKRDHSFMAIGGQWDTVDGGDPSVDDSSLVQTVKRYAKDLIQIDLQNCKHWNRFLEIHYARVGKDGHFSHTEVTVLFVPDLSECLPSLDAWKNQWLAHMDTIAERERQRSLKNKKSREKKETAKGKESTLKDIKSSIEKTEKKKDLTNFSNNKAKVTTELKAVATEEHVGDDEGKEVERKNAVESVKEGANIEKKEEVKPAASQVSGSNSKKPVKKKVIKKIVKQKVKKKGLDNKADNDNNQLCEEDVPLKEKKETAGLDSESPANPTAIKTFIKRKVTEKVLVSKKATIEGEALTPIVKTDEVDKNVEVEDDILTPKVKTEELDGKLQITSEAGSALVKTSRVKTTVKRKIIKKVPKRKAAASKASDEVSEEKIIVDKETQANNENSGEKIIFAEKQGNEVDETEKKIVPKTVSKQKTTVKKNVVASSGQIEIKTDKTIKKEESAEEKSDLEIRVKEALKGNLNEKEIPKSKEKIKSEKKNTSGKEESNSKLSKDVKEKKKVEEPPRPGLILKTKVNKDSKMWSLSLSLDSLLDYSDKDLDESTFELSLFSELFYEMLQYQMGCRLLEFLQKLRIKFVTKRNQRKRQREDSLEKEKDKTVVAKRVKTDELPLKYKLTDDEKNVPQEKEDSIVSSERSKTENESGHDNDEEEEEEEDPEEDEDMQEANENNEEAVANIDAESEPKMDVDKDETKETCKKTNDEKPVDEETPKTDIDTSTENETKPEIKKKELVVVKEVIDKELLQAFLFFDRNRVGYIRVEDMRLILHSLRKLLSHRDVKELVQSALLESNNGRDDRILYKKLVRMTDL